MSPLQIVQANPKRGGESVQGYAKRLLEFASMHYTVGTLDLAIALCEKEQVGKTGVAEDSISNCIILLSEHKTMVAEIYATMKTEGS